MDLLIKVSKEDYENYLKYGLKKPLDDNFVFNRLRSSVEDGIIISEEMDNKGKKVSLDKVLSILYETKDGHAENPEQYPINYGTIMDFIRRIRALSVIEDAEQADWIALDRDNIYNLDWECSKCGNQLHKTKDPWKTDECCPNCGRKMRVPRSFYDWDDIKKVGDDTDGNM